MGGTLTTGKTQSGPGGFGGAAIVVVMVTCLVGLWVYRSSSELKKQVDEQAETERRRRASLPPYATPAKASTVPIGGGATAGRDGTPAVPQSASAMRVTSISSTEAKLAALELGVQGPEQIVPVSLVRDFDSILAKLDRSCIEDRDGIAAMGIVAVQTLRGSGHKVGYLEWLRGIDSLLVSSNAPADGSTDCRVVFASAVTILEK